MTEGCSWGVVAGQERLLRAGGAGARITTELQRKAVISYMVIF